MNTKSKSKSLASLVIATGSLSLALTSAVTSFAADSTGSKASKTMGTMSSGLSALADHLNALRCSEVINMEVSDSSGHDLGKVKDLVIDRGSGAIRFALVSSGGLLGFGDTLRAVPISALKRDIVMKGLVVNIDQAKWKDAPIVADNQLTTLEQAERGKTIFDYYGRDWKASDQQISGSGIAYASEIKGKHVYNNGKDVGSIDDLLVDLPHAKASIVLDPDHEFTGTDANYVMSFNKFKVSPSNDQQFATSLGKADFQAARPFTDYNWDEPDFAGMYMWSVPTSASYSSTSTANNGTMHTASNALLMAVRDALKSDSIVSETAKNITVSEENGRVLLQGIVHTSDMKSRIENKAEKAASGWSIDNQIKVAASN